MQQGEIITAPMGTGAIHLRECSNAPASAIPHVTLMQPEWHDPDTGHITPAKSMELQSAQVLALYKFLRAYYPNA